MNAYAGWLERQRLLRDSVLADFEHAYQLATTTLDDDGNLMTCDCTEFRHEYTRVSGKLSYPQIFKSSTFKQPIPKHKFTVRMHERLTLQERGDYHLCKRLNGPVLRLIDSGAAYTRLPVIQAPSEHLAIKIDDNLRMYSSKLRRLCLAHRPLEMSIANVNVDSALPDRISVKCSVFALEPFSHSKLPYFSAPKLVFMDEIAHQPLATVSTPFASVRCKETLNVPLSSQSLPGTIIVTANVLTRFPQLVAHLHKHGHSIHDRPSYSSVDCWIYTTTARFLVFQEKVEIADCIDNVHVIVVGRCDIGRGQLSKILGKQNTHLHHVLDQVGAVAVIESFGVHVHVQGGLHVQEETAWDRYRAMFDQAHYTPLHTLHDDTAPGKGGDAAGGDADD